MSKKIKFSKYKLLEERLANLENKHEKQSDMMSDLLDYLMRVDENFMNHPGTFEGWYMRLIQLRNADEKRKQCAMAQRTLEEEGYIVAVDDSSLDAARLKKWLQNPTIINQAVITQDDDDDIPF